jgi:regulator of protease activity HflC (stomatin/prohibitin superfamily)
MIRKIRIRKHEVGLWFRRGDFKRVLEPGKHWRADGLFWGGRLERFNTLETEFKHRLLDVLVAYEQVRAQLVVVELADDHRALVWKDGRLGWVLGPGRHAFWKRPYDLKVETFEVSAFKFEHAKLEAVLGHANAARYLESVRVEAHERVLLYREGELVEQFGAGLHVFWKHAGKITYQSVDLREQVADVTGQEIMTADKVTLRVNLLVTYQVVDVLKAVEAVTDYQQALYREAQLALRATIGTRVLDRLLSDKDAAGSEMRDALARRAGQFGLVVRGVGLRDIILPGDMKTILNQVIEAQKQAEANLLRRREETAAARSQANTAKLLAENPVLARMKEFEALTEMLGGAKTTFIFGQGEVGEQVRRLVAQDQDVN